MPSPGFDGDKLTDEINLWRSLTYHDPVTILKRLRALEVQLAGVEMDERVRRLRTPGLKTYREARDAAIFVYGMGLAKAVAMAYTPFERSDYDFVATWTEGTTQHFCPVQLKELVPADLNPGASIEELLGKLCSPRPQEFYGSRHQTQSSRQARATESQVPFYAIRPSVALLRNLPRRQSLEPVWKWPRQPRLLSLFVSWFVMHAA